MGVAMLPQLDSNPAAAHLVSNSGRRSGTKKGVEDKIAGVSGEIKNTLNQLVGLRRVEGFRSIKYALHFRARISCAASKLVRPPSLVHNALLNLGQEFLLHRENGISGLAPINPFI
jgi:hypothetical protein